MLDALASRYHLLPSEVLARSDTLDVLVMDTAISWHNFQEEQARAKREGRPPPPPKTDVNILQRMLTEAQSNG